MNPLGQAALTLLGFFLINLGVIQAVHGLFEIFRVKPWRESIDNTWQVIGLASRLVSRGTVDDDQTTLAALSIMRLKRANDATATIIMALTLLSFGFLMLAAGTGII